MLCLRSLPRWIALSILIGPIFALTAAAQSDDNPLATLHEETRNVVVDVVVTGKDGKAVTGLTQQDFRVYEDGRQQTLTFFEQHVGAATARAAAAAQPKPPLPPDTFTNIPAAPPVDSVNVLLLDTLNTNAKDQIFVRKELNRYLGTVSPGTRIAIFQLGDRLRIIQSFTEDSALLHTVMDHKLANPSSATAARTDSGGTDSTPSVLGADLGAGAVVKKAEQAEANTRTLLTLEALQQIAHYLAGIPGRKNLVWFTTYNPLILSATDDGPGSDASTSPANPHGDSPYYELSKKTVNMLANAQVSVYPIEAAGVAVDPLIDASRLPTGIVGPDQVHILREDAKGRNVIHITMDQLADATGGKAAYNQNGLAEVIAEDIDNGARYYTLAYTPTNRSAKGKERKIEVKLAGVKGNLAYRRSYIEDNPKEKREAQAGEGKKARDPLRALMDRGMPDFTELRYWTRVATAQPQPAAGAARAGDNSALKPPVTRYGIDFTLATENLTLAEGTDGIRRGKVEVALIVYSKDGRPLNWTVHLVGLVVRPDQYAMAKTSGIPFHLDIDAPPGDVYLRSGIYDTSSSKAGTLEIPLSAVTVAQR